MSASHRIRAIPLPGAPTPLEALACLRGLSHRVLLETAEGNGRSWLTAEPVAVLRAWEGRAELQGTVPGMESLVGRDPFTALEGLMQILEPGESKDGNGSLGRDRKVEREWASAGGCFGYLAYEAGDVLERLPPPRRDPTSVPEAGDRAAGAQGAASPHGVQPRAGWPQCWFGVFPWTLVWEPDGGCELRGRLLPGMEEPALEAELARVRELVLGEAPRVQAAADRDTGRAPDRPPPRLVPGPASCPLAEHPDVFSSMGEAGFRAGVERIREYIRAGDLFQANLTHRLRRETELDGEGLLRRLRQESPAPYTAYLDTGAGEVVSVSPESFLSLRGGVVETRPIKGTAPRGASPEEDRALADALRQSEKERAENVMIVDLLRNDLSRVCATVEVPELLRLESHPTVHHLVSSVRGTLREGTSPIDLLRATFPGGSITGAPKIRAMEILRELEPVPRGVYTGAIGVLTFEGGVEFSIAIRTALLRDGVADYGTGGGITLASDAGHEWEETLTKAAAFIRATDL